MVAPTRTYDAVVHGQLVTVKVYAAAPRKPETPNFWVGRRMGDRYSVDETFNEEPAEPRIHKIVDMSDVCDE